MGRIVMAYSLGMQSLSDLDAAILEFESHAPREIAAKEEAIRTRLDISPVRYHQRLNVLLDVPRPTPPTPSSCRACVGCGTRVRMFGAPRGTMHRSSARDY